MLHPARPEKEFHVIVAGGGMAGLSCALFLARARVTVAVFDQAQSSLRRVSRVYNYLGFPDGIGGPELLGLSRAQVERSGGRVFDEQIEAVALRSGGFAVRSGRGPYQCTYFVLASNKRTDLAVTLGLQLGGHGAKFVSADQEGRTPVEGCYAAGRITGLPSQAIISAGDGAKVAIALVQRIRGEYYIDHDT